MRILTKLAAGTTAVVAVAAGLLATAPAQAAPAAAAAPVTGAQAPTAVVAKDPHAMTPIYPRIVPGKLRIDRRCMTGRALCVNKTTRKVHLMLNGKVLRSADVRFGCSRTPTRNGQFKVYRKSRYHVSRQYNSPMPWAMFFSGGQAVHYSADFAARGYSGCSHGCANVRSKSAIDYIYRRTPVGTKVIVYRS
jgi:lipoprotein-anchoring transpeptidase ErfK/SrfK